MKGSVASADGIPIAYEVRGSGNPALVFVHGWSCDRGYWNPQLPHFAERHRVIAIDLPGHGESGPGRAEWTMPAFGADVAAVVHQLGLDEVVLIGHSMGGDVIVAAAGHVAPHVRGLVWIDTYRSLGGPHPSAEEIAAFVAPFRADFKTAASRFLRTMFTPDADPGLVERIVDDMASAPPDIAVDCLEHAITFEPAVCETLLELKLPAIAINPGYRSTDVESMRRFGIEPVVMPGVGHFLHLEDPATFNRLLEDAIATFGR